METKFKISIHLCTFFTFQDQKLIQKFLNLKRIKQNYFFLADNLASEYPEPKDKRAFIISHMYNCNYTNPLPNAYDWPPEFSTPRILPEK